MNILAYFPLGVCPMVNLRRKTFRPALGLSKSAGRTQDVDGGQRSVGFGTLVRADVRKLVVVGFVILLGFGGFVRQAIRGTLHLFIRRGVAIAVLVNDGGSFGFGPFGGNVVDFIGHHSHSEPYDATGPGARCTACIRASREGAHFEPASAERGMERMQRSGAYARKFQ